MKPSINSLVLVILSLFAAVSLFAQGATNVVFRVEVKMANGTLKTNSYTLVDTNQINAINGFTVLFNADTNNTTIAPAGWAITNIVKVRMDRVTEQWLARRRSDLVVRLNTITNDAQLDTIETNIINTIQ